MDNQIIKGLGKGLGQLGQETVEKLVENTGKILDPTITAQELLGGINPMSDQEMAKKKAEDERKKQEEMNKLRSQMSGRSVENEMERIRNQKEKEEEEKEKYFQKVKERKEWERQQQMAADMENMQPKKQHIDKGGNKHKTQQPDPSQMSQTAEFKGKID